MNDYSAAGHHLGSPAPELSNVPEMKWKSAFAGSTNNLSDV